MKLKIEELLDKLGIRTNNVALYEAALTHVSYSNEEIQKGTGDFLDYDRLEFIGDGVLDLVLADILYRKFPEKRSGYLTKARSFFVNGKSLSKYAERLDLLEYARLSKGEMNNNLDRAKLCEDMMEALIGAMYLDKGFDFAYIYIRKLVEKDIGKISDDDIIDAKSKLQELLQENNACRIKYIVVSESGSSQNKSFVINVVCNGIILGTGEGKSKKRAEQEAAKDALQRRVN